jgi:hypothetical protein
VLHDTHIKEAYRVLRETGMMAEARLRIEEQLDSKVQSKASSYLVSLLNNQLGVLSHSAYAQKAAAQVVPPGTPLVTANLPTAVPQLTRFKENQRLSIGLAGIIADVKGIEVIEAIANDPTFKDCDIRLFGFSYTSQETIDRLSSYDNVIVMTNVSDFEFQMHISKLDIFVNYRLHYNGETSLATIEAMRQGVVVLVRDVGWYGELPDDVVVKVKDTEEVFNQLKKFTKSRTQLQSISRRAKAYIAKHYSHEQYAQALAKLIASKPRASHKALVQALKQKRIRSVKQYLSFLKAKD